MKKYPKVTRRAPCISKKSSILELSFAIYTSNVYTTNIIPSYISNSNIIHHYNKNAANQLTRCWWLQKVVVSWFLQTFSRNKWWCTNAKTDKGTWEKRRRMRFRRYVLIYVIGRGMNSSSEHLIWAYQLEGFFNVELNYFN